MSKFVTGAPSRELTEAFAQEGGVVVFGDRWAEGADMLAKASGGIVVAGEFAEELPLPDTLSTYVLLAFVHSTPRPAHHEADARNWINTLLSGVSFAAPGEPEPISKNFHNAIDDGIPMLLIDWHMPDGVQAWSGIHTRQVRRVAMTIQDRYREAWA
jgi:hypothetical protein